MYIFVTNYYNHHQSPFAKEMDLQTDHRFFFIETEEMEEERRNMGWGEKEKPDYVLQAYKSKEELSKCKDLILNADVVIWGSCPFNMIKPRLRLGKLTFAYSERLFKEGLQGFAFWGRAIKYITKLGRYQKNHYLLCASAYAAEDYNRIGLFRDRALKWGYFPKVNEYNIDELLQNKTPNSILWAGRLIDWKHPEMAVYLAKKLKEKGIPFTLDVIGNGPLKRRLCQLIAENQLEKHVRLLGNMHPEQVRSYMEKAQLFLFSSDQNEGWGAVLNEAMNSGCAVVANCAAGSVPFLLCDGKNGCIYEKNDIDEVFNRVVELMMNSLKREEIGQMAYETLVQNWNAETAAKRILEISCCLKNNNQMSVLQGICSPV